MIWEELSPCVVSDTCDWSELEVGVVSPGLCQLQRDVKKNHYSCEIPKMLSVLGVCTTWRENPDANELTRQNFIAECLPA